MRARGIAFLTSLAVVVFLSAADWPQWMGPNRDGVWPETGILAAFPKDGPRKLWSTQIRGGYSGPAVSGGRVYVTDYDRATGDPAPGPMKKNKLTGKERVLCFDATTGDPVWTHSYPCAYDLSYPAGPRCTPTVDAGRVYALGAMGRLSCLDARTGSEVWKKDFVTDYKMREAPMWGFAGHPLVYRDCLICLVGAPKALVVAFDKSTGVEKWRFGDAPEPGYSSPTLVTAAGIPQVVVWYPNELVGLNPESGAKYWGVPLKPSYGMAIMAPRAEGDILYAGGIVGTAVALKLGRDSAGTPTATELWHGKRDLGIYPVNMTPFIHGGVVYGVDQPGVFRACKLATGKRLWASTLPVTGQNSDPTESKVASGTAFVVRNGDRYFLFAETGHLIIANLSENGYAEVCRTKLLEPTGTAMNRNVVWSHPAFADRKVFARNDAELVCYDLAK